MNSEHCMNSMYVCYVSVYVRSTYVRTNFPFSLSSLILFPYILYPVRTHKLDCTYNTMINTLGGSVYVQ